MDKPCYASVFEGSSSLECAFRVIAYILLLVILIILLAITLGSPGVRCMIRQATFRMKHCRLGNSNPNINLNINIDDWLTEHAVIADSIKWQYRFVTNAYDVPESAKRPWPEWSDSEKQDFRQAFDEAFDWYTMTADPFHHLEETLEYPPVNRSELLESDTAAPHVKVDEEYAWSFYIRWVALNLIAETGNHFPWSILEYNTEELQILFDSTAFMSRSSAGMYSICTGAPAHRNFVERDDNQGSSLVAPPRYTYAFLVNNDLLGATRHETIANLLQWVSDNLVHFYGHMHYVNMENHWQYRGIPPITRIIEGTTETTTGEFRHWTAGCHGTCGFLRNVLRAANIPVQIVRICDHALAYFITENLYLDHGDNPYNSDFKATGLPAADLLIDEATYTERFGDNPDNHDDHCEYIGYQVGVLAGRD